MYILYDLTKKLLNRRSIKEGSVILVDQGFISVTTFLTFILLAKATSKEEFGLYVLGWSLLNIALSFADGLITKPFTLQLLNYPNADKRTYLGSSLMHIIGLSTLGGAIVFPVYMVQSSSTQPVGYPAALSSLAVLAVYAYLARNFIRNATLAHLHIYQGAMPNIAGSLLHIIILIMLFFTASLNIYTAFVTLILTCVIASLSILHFQHNLIVFDTKYLISDFKHNWNTGRWLLTNAFSFSLVSYASPWFIAFVMDIKNVAAFGACQSLAAVSAPLVRGINSYLLPRMTHGLAQDGKEHLLRLLWLSTKIIILPFLAWTVVATLLADFLLATLYSNEYTGNRLLLSLLLIRTLIESAGSPVTNALQTLGESRLTIISAVTGAVLTIITGPFLVYMFGIIGAGITVLSTTFIMTIMKWFWIIKLSEKNIPE